MPVSYEWLEGKNLEKNKNNLFKLMEDKQSHQFAVAAIGSGNP